MSIASQSQVILDVDAGRICGLWYSMFERGEGQEAISSFAIPLCQRLSSPHAVAEQGWSRHELGGDWWDTCTAEEIACFCLVRQRPHQEQRGNVKFST